MGIPAMKLQCTGHMIRLKNSSLHPRILYHIFYMPLDSKRNKKTIAFEQAYIQNGDYIIGVGVRSFNAVQDIENDVLKKDLYKILNSIKFSGNL